MMDVIYGKNSLLEALRNAKDNSYFDSIYLLKSDGEVFKLSKEKKIKVEIISKDRFNKILDDNNIEKVNHQGYLGIVKEYKYYDLKDIISNKNDSLIVALDGLEDPHNLGAIVRTCEIAGVDGVILPKNRSVRVTPTVAKVSTGATEYVKIAQVTNLVNTIKELKKEGYWIVGAEASEKSTNFWSVDYNMKVCLVVGSEGKGVSRLVKDNCDFLVEIPMWGEVNSLNASVSCGILIYEIRRQQRSK